MSFSAEIRAKLGLDTADFARGLQGLPAQVDKAGADAARTLQKKFSGADLFRGILQGIGIASVQQIADKLVDPFRESAESAKRISDYSTEAAESTERMLMARKNDLQQLDALEQKLAKIMRESRAPAEVGFFRQIGAGVLNFMGQTALAAKLLVNEEANVEKAAKAAADAAKVGLEIQEKKERIADKEFELLMRNERARAEYVKANREQVELEARALSGLILPAERARLNVLQQQNKIRENEQKISDILQKYPEERTQKEKETLTQLFRQRDVLDKQLTLKEQILAKTLDQATAEEKVGKEVESNIAKWKDLKIAIDSTGRGDRDLSDRELARKAGEIRNDISLREAALLTAGGVFTGAQAQDPFLSAQRSNLGQLLAEQQLREKVRREASFFGEDAAFARNPGLTEQRFRQILEGRGPANDERFLTAIERLERQLGRPLQVVPVGPLSAPTTG